MRNVITFTSSTTSCDSTIEERTPSTTSIDKSPRDCSSGPSGPLSDVSTIPPIVSSHPLRKRVQTEAAEQHTLFRIVGANEKKKRKEQANNEMEKENISPLKQNRPSEIASEAQVKMAFTAMRNKNLNQVSELFFSCLQMKNLVFVFWPALSRLVNFSTLPLLYEEKNSVKESVLSKVFKIPAQRGLLVRY